MFLVDLHLGFWLWYEIVILLFIYCYINHLIPSIIATRLHQSRLYIVCIVCSLVGQFSWIYFCILLCGDLINSTSNKQNERLKNVSENLNPSTQDRDHMLWLWCPILRCLWRTHKLHIVCGEDEMLTRTGQFLFWRMHRSIIVTEPSQEMFHIPQSGNTILCSVSAGSLH